MNVIRHEATGDNPYGNPLAPSPEKFNKHRVVVLVVEYSRLPVPAVDNVDAYPASLSPTNPWHTMNVAIAKRWSKWESS